MDKQEFLELLAESVSEKGLTVEQDDPPYNLIVSARSGEIFRIQVTASRASSTRATALQAGNVIQYMKSHPNADSKEVASACEVSVSYVDILRQAFEPELETTSRGRTRNQGEGVT